jgi:hypothetical protein
MCCDAGQYLLAIQLLGTETGTSNHLEKVTLKVKYKDFSSQPVCNIERASPLVDGNAGRYEQGSSADSAEESARSVENQDGVCTTVTHVKVVFGIDCDAAGICKPREEEPPI